MSWRISSSAVSQICSLHHERAGVNPLRKLNCPATFFLLQSARTFTCILQSAYEGDGTRFCRKHHCSTCCMHLDTCDLLHVDACLEDKTFLLALLSQAPRRGTKEWGSTHWEDAKGLFYLDSNLLYAQEQKGNDPCIAASSHLKTMLLCVASPAHSLTQLLTQILRCGGAIYVRYSAQ